MIRNATYDDIPNIIAMGKTFTDMAGFSEHVGYCEETVEQTLKNLIDNDAGFLLIGEGMIGGVIHPHPFNGNMIVGQELFWWSQGGDGFALKNEIEKQAKAKGCKFWIMLALECARPKAVGRLLERDGYRLIEHNYMKEL